MVVTEWGIGGENGAQRVLATRVGDEVPTSCMSYCNWAVRVVKVVLIVVLVLFCLSKSYCRWLWR